MSCTTPSILVPIDGAVVLKPIASHAAIERVINTRALILRNSITKRLYLHVYDGWVASESVRGMPWVVVGIGWAAVDSGAVVIGLGEVADLAAVEVVLAVDLEGAAVAGDADSV